MRRTVVRSLLLLSGLVLVPVQAGPAARDLTFDERVDAQLAIERVYYSHQVGATKPFEDAVSRQVAERKVRGFLERQAALEGYWHTTFDEDALRREWQRLERDSAFPGRLREIYTALGNDPLLIAECFVRPELTHRMSTSFFRSDERIQGAARRRAESLRDELRSGARPAPGPDMHVNPVVFVPWERERPPAEALRVSRSDLDLLRSRLSSGIGPVEDGPLGYTVRILTRDDPEEVEVTEYLVSKRSWSDWWSREAGRLRLEATLVASLWTREGENVLGEALAPRDPGSCPADDTWDNGPFDDTPGYVTRHAAVWTGSEMLVWGGAGPTNVSYPTGWRYDPGTDAWSGMNRVGAPISRGDLTAVWTGTEMIVWGGISWSFINHNQFVTNTGGRYDPATDTWQPVSLVNAPTARRLHTAVWTGSRMVVWGGSSSSPTTYRGDGASYDPATDTWSPISSVGAPSPREFHTAVWTGTEMVIWGGRNASWLGDGARYAPASDTWTPLPSSGAPSPRIGHTAVWSGSEMIVFAGQDQFSLYLQDGAKWSEGSGWTPTSLVGAPAKRGYQVAVWTGDRMLVWGGERDTGGFYDPQTNQWGPATSLTNAPSPRSRHTGVWTGDTLIVFGGEGNSPPVKYTGGRYDVASDTWTPTSTGGPAATATGITGLANRQWTGTEILWVSYNTDGYAYDPLTDTDRIIPASGRSSGGTGGGAVWTGSELILWGYSEGQSGVVPGHGLRYNPIGDVWTVMSLDTAPYARSGHSMIWTGSLLIVWGGQNSAVTDPNAQGQRYDPATDQWLLSVSTVNAPSNRYGHCSVWDGDEMIVYGGTGPQGPYSGGRYRESTNTWSPMAEGTVVPNTCTWNGTEWLLLGSDNVPFSGVVGRRYQPDSDTWAPITSDPSPAGTVTGRPAWTGSLLVTWGGLSPDPNVYAGYGQRYDPLTDTWSTTTLNNAPAPRNARWVEWVDRYYLVGGGNWGDIGELRDGGRYVVNVDAEGDGVPELCDNCPGLANADQLDTDGDNLGDACDSCTDTDGDAFGDPGFPGNVCALDNCPAAANPTQDDLDADGTGDACDSCTDTDHDGAGNPGFPMNTCATDNCVALFNAAQLDTDTDGLGDLCDICPDQADPGQADADGDGAGDACDCQAADPNDRAPGAILDLIATRPAPGTIALSWSDVTGADAYSVTRGDLASLGSGSYGDCAAEGLVAPSYEDGTPLGNDEGFAYLIQAQSYDCGLGILGRDGAEVVRVNGPGACQGNPHTDGAATGESAVFGTTTGALSNTNVSDDLVQTITEEVTSGSPSTRISRLEHRWTFALAAGAVRQLHVEGLRSTSTDGDDFRFEYSTDGTSFTPIAMTSLPFADDGIDLVGTLPGGAAGSVTIRVVDTDRTPGNQTADSVSVDQMFVRASP